MSPDQERNLNYLQERFEALLDAKYREGDKEHGGGNLFQLGNLELIDNAIAEVLDLYAYLMALRKKLL